MSGVICYAEANGAHAGAVLDRMASAMRHLPHHMVESAAPEHGIAGGRLHIGIFNQSAQPVVSAGGDVHVWMCGEFYQQQENRRELAVAGLLAANADDAALALAIYLRDGLTALANLNGAFIAAVWDKRVGELIVVNDRYGIYPHFYSHTHGSFALAPEMKSILAVPHMARRLDQVALAQYVRFQQFLGDRTWFEDVKLLPPATILRYSPAHDTLSLQRYWDWDSIQLKPHISFDEAVEETIRVFQQAIDAMTSGPYRMGAYLSGGLDGRTILGFTRPEIPLQTVTFGEANCRDVVYARELARRARRPNRWFPLQDGRWVEQHAALHLALIEGQHTIIHAHGISTLAEARQLMDINLSGWDGGTTLGGRVDTYEKDHLFRSPQSEADLQRDTYEAFIRRFVWPGLTDSEASNLWQNPELDGLARESLNAEIAKTSHYTPDRRMDYFVIEQLDRRQFQHQVTLMRAAIEVRCPFYDYAFVEHIYSLPVSIRATPRLVNEVITRRMPSLAMVPYDATDRLPHTNPLIRGAHAFTQKLKNRVNRHIAPIFHDRPRLYADYEEYLRTDLRPCAESILFDRRVVDRGLFRPEAVRTLWDRHISGAELWTVGKIAPLISLELVLRSFFDES